MADKRDPITGERSPGRVCIDPRLLNAQLVLPDRHELPRVSDVFAFLAGKDMFSLIDLAQSYLQLPIAVEDRHNVSFTWRGIHYSFQGTPFGLSLTASVLQRLMTCLFDSSSSTIPFQDDLSTGSSVKDMNSPDEHLEHLIVCIDSLTAANLRIQVTKSKLFRRTLHLPGHTFSSNGISVD